MDAKEFYALQEKNPIKAFLERFGGEFYDGMNFGYLYELNKISYYLTENFIQLADDSLKQDKNLLIEILEKVVW